MNNQEYKLMVDELLTVLAEKGFTRQEAEVQLSKLLALSILRIQKEFLEQAAVPKQSLTLPELEKFLSEYADNNPKLATRLAQEFEILLKDYLAAVGG